MKKFVDESHTLIGSDQNAAEVLAKARNYDLGMIAAKQFDKQLDQGVKSAFYQNTGSKIEIHLQKPKPNWIKKFLWKKG